MLDVEPTDRDRLRRRLIDTYDEEGPYVERHWHSAKHERSVDAVIGKWERTYQAQHPKDWERMRDNLGGLAHTNTEATVEKKYKVLRPVRLETVKRDGSSTEDDEPIFAIDYEHLMRLQPHLKPTARLALKGPRHDFAWFNPSTPRDKRADRAGFALDREVKKRRPDLTEILAALRLEERELLLPQVADYPGGRAFRMTFLTEPAFALRHPTIDFQKRFWTLYLGTGGTLGCDLSFEDCTDGDSDFYMGANWQRYWGWRYENGILRRLWRADQLREFYLDVGWVEWWNLRPPRRISRFRPLVSSGG